MLRNQKRLKERYRLAKSTKVGEMIICPSCGTEFKKTNYQQAFCKSRGKTKCKDHYWNNVDPSKQDNRTRISPASAAWLASQDSQPAVLGYGNSQKALDRHDMMENELNFDGCWDSHPASVERCEWCECINCRCEN